jgi:glycerol-3-phosphate dehydrogenase
MTYDLFIIGGGVNGCGIARDAAGRGLSVFLAEKNDLASATSSASTKLIHGGLRYLEHYEFRLVREALIEREVLLNSAPHIIWPLRFVLPHHAGLRPRWLIRLGLFMYDHLGGRKILPPTRSVDFQTDVTGVPLKDEFHNGYEYSDCWVEDARLVVLMARDAANKSAVIRTRTTVRKASRVDGGWHIEIENAKGDVETISAKVLVNAAGPWVSEVLTQVVGRNDADKIRMVKGSHLVVDRLYDHDRCYIFQNADNRICFAIPYETNFTLIGTTDEDHKGDPGKPEITLAETEYLLAAVSEYFKKRVTKDMIRWSYSGIRPLYDDGASSAQEATRDYVLKLDQTGGQAPLLSIFGGKITTHRRLAEHALEKLAPFFPKASAPWTAKAKLPGGMEYAAVSQYIAEQQKVYSFLKPQNVLRLFRAYGTDMQKILQGARFASDLGKSFGPLSEREVKYLRDNEWVQSADDILWRRSKLGLHMRPEDIQALRDHFVDDVNPKKAKKAKNG